MKHLGNLSLLDQQPVGFLCSRTTASSAILPCLDWAMEMSKGSVPVMSTFHSEIENAVFDILLRGKCPVILVLGRSIYKKIPEKLQSALDAGRLLIISVIDRRGINRESAHLANHYICENAANVTFGSLSQSSSLYSLYEEVKTNNITHNIISYV